MRVMSLSAVTVVTVVVPVDSTLDLVLTAVPVDQVVPEVDIQAITSQLQNISQMAVAPTSKFKRFLDLLIAMNIITGAKYLIFICDECVITWSKIRQKNGKIGWQFTLIDYNCSQLVLSTSKKITYKMMCIFCYNQRHCIRIQSAIYC